MTSDLKVFPVTFTEPTDERIVVVQQLHQKQFADGVKPSTIHLTITWEDENVVIPIIATEGSRKTANARLTIGIGDERKLISYLERAIADAEDFIQQTKRQRNS